MKKHELLGSLVEHENDLRNKIIKLQARNDVSKSTKSTQRHHLRREQRITTLLKEVVSSSKDDEIKLSDEALIGFNQLCVRTGKVITRIEVEEGDSILELMSEYEDIRDLKKKLDKAAEKIGCKLNFATGLVEKKA